MNITELLARRSDLSTFLVHLTRDRPGVSARQALQSILRSNRLTATQAFGLAHNTLAALGLPIDSQRAVCFTETPLEHLSLLTQAIEGRQQQFKPYGVALTKKVARGKAINPVWYIDATMGYTWRTNDVNALVASALARPTWQDEPILKLTPFFEVMGTWEQRRKEFWWEREWRHAGDVTLPTRVIGLCPEDEIGFFQTFLDEAANGCTVKAKFIDPNWSLERTIAHLAGMSANDVDLL